jgi:serine phosphatase RsbU (regulator of sigma subunit)
VSGDFYYLQEINQKTILAVVDCTGHGVPGALMTMLGNETLNEIIIGQEITEPDQILNELHKRIRKTLKQAETQNRDGMDLSMIVWDKEAQTVSFAGAKNPLVYVLRNEVYTLKADSFGIGGEQLEEERVFAKQTIDMRDIGEVTFYLFSDGYQDQFGGERNKKFGLKRMKQLFLDMHTWEMPQQCAHLAQHLTTWQEAGKEKQIDDVLVVGVKI